MDPEERWNEALALDPRMSPDEFLARVVASGATYGDRPLCAFRRPLFVSESTARACARMLGPFHTAIQEARALLVSDGLDGRPDSLAVQIGVDPAAVALAAIEPGYASAAVLARVDTYTVDGVPRVLELNAEAPTGMAYGDALTDVFLADPLIELVGPVTALRSADAAVRAIVAAWREWGGQGQEPTVALVDLPGVPTWAEFRLFQQRFEALHIPCMVATPDQLRFDGERLLANDVPIDVVYRRLLVADVLANPAMAAPLVDAYAAGKVCVVNSFRTALLHGKGLFALLHDPDFLARMSPSVQDAIRRHVPWTGLLRDRPGPGAPADLRERVRRAPEGWVLKPLAGHGGKGVLLGWTADRSAWERAIDEADAHVVQRRQPEARGRFPDARQGYAQRDLLVSLDPYLVRGRLAGFLCRLGPGELSNVAEGGSQVPVFIASGASG